MYYFPASNETLVEFHHSHSIRDLNLTLIFFYPDEAEKNSRSILSQRFDSHIFNNFGSMPVNLGVPDTYG